MKPDDFQTKDEIAWCPGCGDFGILNSVRKALANLQRAPKDIVLVSGIGQAAKLPHYVRANCFNGLHGRALPVASAIKMVNPNLTVIVTTGDGDCYGEGGNHFLHAIRRNLDITLIVHNNQIYGLTKGQASPTTDEGFVTGIQTHGVILEPFHSLGVAMALGIGFVARGYSKDSDRLSEIIVEGVRYKGFALIEVLQPCVSFNSENTYTWYSERVYDVNSDPNYSPSHRALAFEKAFEWGDKIPTGIIYHQEKKTYEERSGLLKRRPLVEESIEYVDISRTVSSFL